MIKHSYTSCPVCHADPSGGELLTAYGRAQSDILLRMRYGAPGGGSASRASAPVLARNLVEPRSDASSGADDAASDDTAKSDDASKEDATQGEGATDEAASDASASGEASSSASSSGSESGSADELPASSFFLWGLVKPPDWLLLGGSYRHLSVFRPGRTAKKFVTFPMMADVYGQIQIGNFRVNGSIGAVRVGVGSPYARAAQITRGQGDQWNLLSRTHWLGYDFADGTITLRAGHMNLPFGVRIPEHTMWARQTTRTDRESAQQDGLALSYNGADLRTEVMLIAGNYQINPDKYRERGYSAYAEYLTSARTAIGISSLVTSAQKDRITLHPNPLRQAHGVFVRNAFSDRLVLLAEADGLFTKNRDPGYVGFAQFDFELTQGLHLMATGEALDQGYDTLTGGGRTLGNGKLQLGAWGSVDWYFLPHCDFRADLFSRQNDEVTVLGQLHVFL